MGIPCREVGCGRFGAVNVTRMALSMEPRRLITLAGILFLAACASAGGSGISSYLRGATAGQLGCAAAEVQISDHGTTLSDETWDAAFRGVLYRCTRTATGYGAALTCLKSQKQPAAEPAALQAEARKTAAAAPGSQPSPPAESAESIEIRATLDREREAILACGSGRAMGLKATVQPDRSLDVHLTGDLAGTPQEGCVRHLLIGLQVPGVSPGTVVIHVLR